MYMQAHIKKFNKLQCSIPTPTGLICFYLVYVESSLVLEYFSLMIGRKSTNLNTAYDFQFVVGGPGEVLQEFSDVFLLSFPNGSYI